MSLYESSGSPGTRVAPVSPITALRQHWFIALVIIVVFALLGLLVGRAKPVTYTAQARLAVGGQDLKNFEIPGFTLAAEEVASNYARYVGLPQSQQTFRAVLGKDASKVLSVDGSPIATSNIILIEVSATTRAIALSASNTVANTLMAEANATNTPQTSSYLSQYTKLTAQLYALQTQVDAAKLVLANLTTQAQTAADAQAQATAKAQPTSTATGAATTPTTPAAVPIPNTPAMQAQQLVINNLQTELSVVSVQQSTLSSQYTQAVTGATSYSQLVSAQPAVITVVTRTRTLEKYGLAGVVLGVLVALIVASVIEARRRRREDARSGNAGYGSAAGPAGTPGGPAGTVETPDTRAEPVTVPERDLRRS